MRRRAAEGNGKRVRAKKTQQRRLGLILVATFAFGLVLSLILILTSGPAATNGASGTELVGYVPYARGTDLQLQRRSGTHTLDGGNASTTLDLAFAGADDGTARGDGGIEIIDVTDPSKPASLTRIPCPGVSERHRRSRDAPAPVHR